MCSVSPRKSRCFGRERDWGPKQGRLLPGREIVPERIRENRQPYYAALEAADIAWDQGHFNVNLLAADLGGLLKDQISEKP